jgi:hypothetical protein
MNNIKKLMLLFLINTSMYQITASDQNSDSSFNSGNTSFESFEDEDNNSSVAYFIEKPTENWETEYFEFPVIIKAIINKTTPTKGSKKLPWLKGSSMQENMKNLEEPETISIIYPVIDGDNRVPKNDFIQCSGPTRRLTTKEYKDLLYKFE